MLSFHCVSWSVQAGVYCLGYFVVQFGHFFVLFADFVVLYVYIFVLFVDFVG